MPHYTRREVLRTGAGAAAMAMLPRPLLVRLGGPVPLPIPPIEEPDVKELALAAVAAARKAGATYADVRLTHTYKRKIDSGSGWGTTTIDDAEGMHVGVRSLADGYWGFATSPIWDKEDMARLGQESVRQAKANVLGMPNTVGLAAVPKVVDEHWETPIHRDPFKGSPWEIADYLNSLEVYASYHLKTTVGGQSYVGKVEANYQCVVQEKAFASTEGSYCTQRLIRSGGDFYINAQLVPPPGGQVKGLTRSMDFATSAAVGWELYPDQTTMRTAMQQVFAEMVEELVQLSWVPLEVGRYDAVLDARSVAGLLSGTLGRATELDRALGYEANAGGTSYINDPFGMVGTYPLGAELLTVTGNRTDPGACATVRWDDEGVAPEPFTVVKDGVLHDFPTTRESAGWLKDQYERRQQPVRSHGCAAAPTAREAPMLHPANLVLTPGRENQGFNELVGTMKTGIAVRDVRFEMDFQALNGIAGAGMATYYQVKDGKLKGIIYSPGWEVNRPALLIRSPELWKGLVALGGAQSARRFGLKLAKGEPAQEMYHSVTAPPAVFKQLTMIDGARRP